ncbi:MAG: ABC transporter substrate-binding protein, partial [Acetobacteraceae bacterium]|nr:ABC transporter substrate-binding protein [Acetobacteraceae bacterium]
MAPIARRSFAAVAALAAARPLRAQSSWPSRPITVLVPNPPGGGTDFAARLFQDALSRALGTSVV